MDPFTYTAPAPYHAPRIAAAEAGITDASAALDADWHRWNDPDATAHEGHLADVLDARAYDALTASRHALADAQQALADALRQYAASHEARPHEAREARERAVRLEQLAGGRLRRRGEDRYGNLVAA